MAYINPSVSDFKTYFNRDFPYQPAGPPDLNLYIQDADIQKAIDITTIWINSALFTSQQFYTIGFMYLTAHNLVEAVKAWGQGAAGVYEFLVQSKAVGSVSVSFAIPEYVLRNPYFAMIMKDPYGAKYMELVLPYLTGAMFTVCGKTHA